jgi:predicted ATPase/DNA-binding CsgD family transcriptional regulator/DNA-binding XRE family transcriptional regulator
MTPTHHGAFGPWLRSRREQAGLTQEELAARSGLTAKGIAALERGRRRRPYPHTVRALAMALGLSSDEQADLLARVAKDATVSGPPVAGLTPALRASPTPLIGRDHALAEVLATLRDHHARLITLTGPGGVGKTSLALEAVRRSTEDFPDGVVVVELDVLDDPELLMARIAARMGLTGLAEGAETAAVHRYLQDRRLLLVLDNFEHLLAAVTDVSGLMEMCPEVKLLVTSRAPLRLRGEREYAVGPLAVPDLTRIPASHEIAASAAVQLFVERAQVASTSFGLSQANTAAVAAICRRLDGLPLALELAAARLRILSPTELLARLDTSLPLLTGGARDLPERQRTIRQAIEWSYRLLGSEEQGLFRRLSIFVGGWDAAAAEAVSGLGPDALDVLSALVEHSLVIVETAFDGRTRYRMLETIRQFGDEQREAAGETAAMRDRHLAWFASLASDAERQLNGPEQGRWLQHLELDYDNLRSALSWALGAPDPDRREEGLRLAGTLWSFWYMRGYFVEGEAWLRMALAGADTVSISVRAKGLCARGMLTMVLGNPDAAVTMLEEGLQAAQESGLLAVEALAHFGLGDATRMRAEHDRAERHYRLALAVFRELQDHAWTGITLNGLALIASGNGALEQAEELAQEGLRLLRASGDARNTAEAIVIIGDVAYLREDTARAASSFGAALTAFWELGDRLATLLTLTRLAEVAMSQGDAEPATRLIGAVTAVRDKLLQQDGGEVALRGDRGALTNARHTLGDEAFERAWQAGRELPLEAAVAEAQVLASAMSVSRPPAPVGPPEHPGGLSQREVEVLRCVAAGLTNGETADRLYISRRTVDAHMRRIYDKLDLARREDVVRFALEHGIT